MDIHLDFYVKHCCLISQAQGETETETTKVIYGADKIMQFALEGLSRLKLSHNVCLDSQGISVIVSVPPVKDAYSDLGKRGVRVRIITEVTRENIRYCNEVIKFAELRHLDGIRGNFSISDGRDYTAIATVEEARPLEQLIYSNVRAVAKQQQYFFETLWSKATPAEHRIKEVMDGVEASKIEVIEDPRESIDRAWKVVGSARNEVLLMFSSVKGFRRQLRMGGLGIVQRASENGANVRILVPTEELVEDIGQMLAITSEARPKTAAKVEIRTIDKSLESRLTMLVADRKELMIFELKDDNAANSYDAAGIATYSNAHSIVSSYTSILESFWKQSELYEKLKVHDRMQREFINIAAHELRTPIQPILALSGMLESDSTKLDDNRIAIDVEDMQMIIRNARRLERLATDILEVARIESQGISLCLEEFNLKDILSIAVKDIQGQMAESKANIKLVYNPQDILLLADKGRLLEVLSNLLSNAAKFTKEGSIVIRADIVNDDSRKAVTVSVQDSGTGIKPEIFSRLFSKFVTSSMNGTGLGLYISKKIVEAHGGTIFGYNNQNGHGATFRVILPLHKEIQKG